MCLTNEITEPAKKFYWKIFEKVEGGYRPVFRIPRYADSRTYKIGVTYIPSHSYKPFHAWKTRAQARRALEKIKTEFEFFTVKWSTVFADYMILSNYGRNLQKEPKLVIKKVITKHYEVTSGNALYMKDAVGMESMKIVN